MAPLPCFRAVTRHLAVFSVAGMFATSAGATWSIIICDTRTGEVAVGSATCLTNFDLQANTPVLVLGVGGATAQSFVDSTGANRTLIRDHLYTGASPNDILAALSVFDSSHQNKQYGIADVFGRTATFSGTGAGAWKGGTTGSDGDLVFAVQGNVLWGPLVVEKAVEAILNTPGDVPAKLMASMEAARAWGGDGRCSCSPAFPTGCTTLPDTFKSAHIAYMLIGRAGDREGSNGNYRATNYGNAAAPGDFNGDGMPDVVVCGAAGLAVLLNTTPPGRQATLASAIPTTLGFTGRDLDVADFNHDGRLDVAVTNNTGNAVAVLLGNGDGTFAAPVVYATGAGPQGLAVGDLDGNGTVDLVVANFTGDSCSIFLNDGQGVMTLATTLATGDGSQFPILADLEDDGDLDVIVTNANARTVATFRNNGDATFVAGTSLAFASPPIGIDAGDLNGDGRIDLAATTNGDPLVKILLQNADGTFSLSTYSVFAAPGNPLLRDHDGDGHLDLLALQRTGSRLYVFKGNADGTFQPGVWYPVGFAPNLMRAADMDGDGQLDAVVRVASTIVCIMQGTQGGGFNPVSGLAGGDYFMTFNVANKINSDPDPVFILHDMFDAWRADLVGKPDAVRSLATLDPPVLHTAEAAPATLSIRARDWQLSDVSLAGASVSVASSSGVVTVGSPVLEDDGTVTVPVTAGSGCGHDTLTVTIEGPGRRVILMPVTAVIVSDPADFDRSGFVDTDDFDAFVQAFIIGEDDADFDGSGFVDTDDFTEFVLAFEDPC